MSRKKILYRPNQNEPFELSRSKVELFLSCPRCFYLDRSEAYRIARPSGPMSYIPTAIDTILKENFHISRDNQEPHPYMTKFDIEAVPFQHSDIKTWQNNRQGIRYHDPNTNLVLFGAIDDCWKKTGSEELFIADYKSTTAAVDPKTKQLKEVNLDEKTAPWKYWYKKQVEFYQWLFRKNNFTVSNTAYFLFCSALYKGVSEFDEKLNFKIDIVAYEGDDAWVENTVNEIKDVLDRDTIPNSNPNCVHCNYASKINHIE